MCYVKEQSERRRQRYDGATVYGVGAGGVPLQSKFSSPYFVIVFIWKNDYLVLYGSPSKQWRLTLQRNT